MPHINLGIPEDLLAEIDEARGSIPRTTWIRESVKQRLGASILHQQMAAVAPLRGGPVKVVDPAVPMPPQVKAAIKPKPSFSAPHPDEPCSDLACPRFACRSVR